jgi:hypothetical protein
MLSSPEFGDCTVALFWDEKVHKYTQLRYFLGSKFDIGDEGEVTDTFELLDTGEGIVYAHSLAASRDC